MAPSCPRWAAVAAAITILFPLTIVRRMDRLSAFSLLGFAGEAVAGAAYDASPGIPPLPVAPNTAGLVAGIIALGVYCSQDVAGAARRPPADSDFLATRWDGAARFFGIALFAIEGIASGEGGGGKGGSGGCGWPLYRESRLCSPVGPLLAVALNAAASAAAEHSLFLRAPGVRDGCDGAPARLVPYRHLFRAARWVCGAVA